MSPIWLRTTILALALAWVGTALTGIGKPGEGVGASIATDGEVEILADVNQGDPAPDRGSDVAAIEADGQNAVILHGDTDDPAFVEHGLSGRDGKGTPVGKDLKDLGEKGWEATGDVSGVVNVAANNTAKQVDPNGNGKFCWRETYGRGVGEIPKRCATGQVQVGWLCYEKCQSGYTRSIFDCHQDCPEHWRDDGLFCRHAEYGRGGGNWKQTACESGAGAELDPATYGWHEREDGEKAWFMKPLGCEKHGLLWYPKCKQGYHNFGCCICRPSRPNCEELGMMPGAIDLSCAKKIKIGSPRVGTCKSDQERQLGLCYDNCRPGFKGIGPVCWGEAPPGPGADGRGWGICGMGAVSLKGTCAAIIVDQVMAVGDLAMNLASGGIASLGNSANPGKVKKSAQLAAQWNNLKTKYKKLKNQYEELRDAEKQLKVFKDAKNKADGLETMINVDKEIDSGDLSTADVYRLSASISSLFDPSGVYGVIAAYTYDKCGRFFREFEEAEKEKERNGKGAR